MASQFKTYESQWELILPHQTPIIVRLDGKAFHTFTKQCDKPYDDNLHNAMVSASVALCKEIQNIRFAYTQSDEISLLIYEKSKRSCPWYGNRVQKICSVAASICSNEFNLALQSDRLASFDARAFPLSKEEVQKYFSWRQDDSIKNSISALAQNHFPKKLLFKKNRHEMIAMLHSVGISWSELASWKRIGSVVVKTSTYKDGIRRSRWDRLQICPVFSMAKDFFSEHLSQTED